MIRISDFYSASVFLVLCQVVLSLNGYSQANNLCSTPSPFCTGGGGQYTFPAGVNAGSAQTGPNYGCLYSQPNPAWYFMQIANPGSITIDISSTPYNDIDFICYGPFNSLNGVCTAQLSAANTVDCSYSASGYEQVNINNAQTGQFYMVLVTNFSNQACNINFNLNAGGSTGTTNCGIIAGPVSNNGPICEGDTLKLNAQTVPNAISYDWTGPNGFTASGQNIVIPNAGPAMSGTYSLVVSDVNGSAAPVTTTAVVNPIPAAPQISSNSPVCAGQQLTFTAQNVANGTFQWSGPAGFSSALQNPVISSASGVHNGNFIARVQVNGCWSPYDTIPVTVYLQPVPIITGPPLICAGTLGALTTTTPYPQYVWSNGGTTNDTAMVSAGSYTVTVTDTNGCVGTSAPFTVAVSNPVVTITGMQIYCENTSLQLTASGNGFATYLWSDGTSQPTAFTTGGQFWVAITDTVGCPASDTVTTTPSPLPVADFSHTNVCNLFSMPFTDASTVSVGTVNAWSWDFSTGQTANTANPQNLFPADGLYNVKLTVTTADGCVDSVVKPVTVYPLPVVNFAAQPQDGCVPHVTTFDNQTTISSGIIDTYFWDFGGGQSSTAFEPTKGYSQVDTFAVTLIAISNYGCRDTLTINDAVITYPNPVAEYTFDPTDIYLDNPVVMFNYTGNGATIFNWYFDDGETSTFMSPTHIFSSVGTFNTTLYVENQYGCNDTYGLPVTVKSPFAVYIPNTFSPNNDGMNDIFTVTGNGLLSYELMIYDRWGQLIIQGANISWDGRIGNRLAKQDAYVYKVKAYDVQGLEHYYQGYINLIRGGDVKTD